MPRFDSGTIIPPTRLNVYTDLSTRRYNGANVSKVPAVTGKANRSSRGPGSASRNSEARERVLATAYKLFSHHGIRAVGVDAIIASAGVAKMTLYRHFPSKDDLVLAFLQRREQLWTVEWLEARVKHRAANPEQRLLAIFDVFGEWFRRDDFEGCSFINALLEMDGRSHPVRRATTSHLARIREFVHGLAEDAGISQPDDFAHKWHILMKGAIVAAGEGDKLAARRAHDVGLLLLQSEVRKQQLERRPGRDTAKRATQQTSAIRRKVLAAGRGSATVPTKPKSKLGKR
jgi:AcrR family transcriptional regulator